MKEVAPFLLETGSPENRAAVVELNVEGSSVSKTLKRVLPRNVLCGLCINHTTVRGSGAIMLREFISYN